MPRINVHALHVIAGENVGDARVHLAPRDASVRPLRRIPVGRAIVRPVRDGETVSVRRLRTERRPVTRPGPVEAEADLGTLRRKLPLGVRALIVQLLRHESAQALD